MSNNPFDKHHIIPKSRCKELGVDPNFDGNTVRVKTSKHRAWHTLFGNKTPEEAIAQIEAEWSLSREGEAEFKKTHEREIFTEEKTMNCDLETCKKHILATTQVAWNGGNYHADCVMEAVNQSRARQEIPSAELNLPDDYYEQLEQHDADFYEGEDVEFQDDIDEFEQDFADAIDRFDKPTAAPITPEVIESDYHSMRELPVNLPQGSVMTAPRAIIHPPANGNLIAHCGAGRLTRGELLNLPLPEETDTYKPVAHHFLVQTIEEALAFRHISITKEEFAVTPDGLRFFAVLQVNAQHEGVNFAIGLRNANDKSMRLGIVAGYKVTVCDNLAFVGEFKPMLAKHSKHFDLIEAVSIAVDRLQRGWKPIREMIDFKRSHELSDGKARDMLYQLFTTAKLPISLFKTTHHEFFVKPSFDEFRPKTLWSLENAVTTSIKKLNPISQYENTAKLGKFITAYTNNI